MLLEEGVCYDQRVLLAIKFSLARQEMPVKRETVLAHSIHQSPMVGLHRQESSRYPENRDAAVVREGSLEEMPV